MGPWAFGVPLALVSALGLLLNAYVLVVIGLGKQTQQQQQAAANTLLLIHLGAVEAAVCLVLLIFATGSWPAAGTWCVIHGFLLALLHPVALWTVTGLNCDRYYAIAAPLHYSAVVSPRRVALGLGISWAGALLLCLPPFSGLVPPYRYVPGLGCCAPDFGQAGWGSAGALYGAIYALLGLALPALLVTLCNLRVLGIARYHRHRIASAIYEVTLSAQVTITHQRNPFFVPAVTAPSAGGPPRFHSAASTVMQLVGSLYLLYFPYCGLILWEACGSGGGGSASGSGNSSLSSGTSSLYGSIAQQPQQQQAAVVARLHAAHPRFASLASLLLACSPPINGLLYGLKSRMLRSSVQNYWRKKATKSELQQEIQARTPSAAGSRRPSVTGPSSSFFPFPPLQRRLSEALIALGNCRAAAAGFGSGNIANMFHRARLQPAASCNTLRVPNAELGESRRLVRSSASAASLMGPSYRNDFAGGGGVTGNALANGTASTTALETPKRSPRILITRAYSEESQDGGSPLLRKPFAAPISLPPCEKRRWRHRSTESDSSTGSSDASVWTTGVQAAKPPRSGGTNGKNPSDMWPCGRRFSRVKTLEEGAAVFSVVLANRMAINNNNYNSSESTDIATDVAASQAVRPINELRVAESEISCDEKDEEEEEEVEEVEVGRRTPEDEQRGSASSSSWSCAEDNTAHSALNSRASSECGLVMHPIGETTENSHPKQEEEEQDEEEEEEEVCRPEGGGGKRARRKSRISREAETVVVVDQLRPLLTSSS